MSEVTQGVMPPDLQALIAAEVAKRLAELPGAPQPVKELTPAEKVEQAINMAYHHLQRDQTVNDGASGKIYAVLAAVERLFELHQANTASAANSSSPDSQA